MWSTSNDVFVLVKNWDSETRAAGPTRTIFQFLYNFVDHFFSWFVISVHICVFEQTAGTISGTPLPRYQPEHHKHNKLKPREPRSFNPSSMYIKLISNVFELISVSHKLYSNFIWTIASHILRIDRIESKNILNVTCINYFKISIVPTGFRPVARPWSIATSGTDTTTYDHVLRSKTFNNVNLYLCGDVLQIEIVQSSISRSNMTISVSIAKVFKSFFCFVLSHMFCLPSKPKTKNKI